MVIKLPRSRESTPVAVTPPSTSQDRALAVYVLRQAGSATRHVRVGAYLSGFGGGPDSLCKFQEMEVCDVP